jgi:hypothetical protein
MKYNHVDAAMKPLPQPACNFDGSLLQIKGDNTMAQVDELKAVIATMREALLVAHDELEVWAESYSNDGETRGALETVSEALAESRKFI